MKQQILVAKAIFVALLTTVASAQTIDENTLTSVAEISGYTKTATYDEVMRLCRDLSKSPRIHLTTMGKTSQGRDIPLMVIGNDPPTEPSTATRRRLTIYVQGNIHAGEVCGKEAVLILARELFNGQHPDLLNNAILLFAPIYNADGNQPLSKENRPEQHGPDGGVGQRANAQGLDLNRDHLKLEAPEARAFARVMTEWDPAVVMDLHTTNGSYHRFHLTYDGPRAAAAPKNLVDYMRDNFLPEVSRRMEQATGYKSFYYGNFNEDHDRWNSYPAWPRYGTQYVAVRGRLSILSEAYAYASYRDRVLATRQFVLDCLRLTVERKNEIQTMLKQSRDNWNRADLSGKTPADARLLEIPVRTDATTVGRKFTALGYDDSTRPEGARRGVLPTKPQDYEVEFVGLENPIQSVKRPFAYLIPADQTKVIENLAQQGIQLDVVREGVKIDVESYRIDKVTRAERAFQNHFLVDVQATGETGEKMIAAGTIVAKTAQDLGRLLIQMLEPASQDGLVKWNFFDDSLKDGATFPIVRLMQDAGLKTAPYAEKKSADAPKKRVGFEDIYGRKRINFSGSPASGHRWLPDGEHYAKLVDSQWRRVNAETGQSEPLFDHDLLRGALASLPGLDSKRARRLISRLPITQLKQGTALWNQNGDFFTARLDGTAAARVTDTRDRDELGELSPDGNQVAFVRNYDLFVAPAAGGATRQLTFDGNSIIRHGKADWVYYEEIYNRDWKGYRWSPDSQRIAFMQYNDTPVKPFVVLDHMPHRLDVENERYPKAGDPIPTVQVGVVSVVGGPVTWINLRGYSADNLIVTRYGWLPDSNELYV
ncbi:MAG: DPP IV N-terminal domain-containing protein, partial [Planctomycetota bacterium]